MRFLSLFSGIEAASAAWLPLGWECVGVAEIEPFACAVLASRYPGVPNLGDVLAPDFLQRAVALRPDVLVGGPPCQDFSIAGLRAGLDGARGNLSLRWVEVVRAIRPAYAVTENVPGWLSVNRGHAFGAFLAGLVGHDTALVPPRNCGGRWTNAGMVAGPLGRVAWRVMDAQYFGLAQRRQRVFAVFCPRDGADPGAVLFERKSLQGHSPPRREAGKGITGTLSSRATAGGGLGTDFDCSGGLIAHALRAEGFDAGEDGTGRGTPLVPVSVALRGREGGGVAELGGDCAHAIRASQGGGDKPHVLAFDARQSDVIQYGDQSGPLDTDGHTVAVAFHENQRAEVTTSDTAGSLKTGGGKPGQGYPAVWSIMPQNSGRDYKARQVDVAQPVMAGGPVGGNQGGDYIQSAAAVRRLTPVECARLQGFPDTYLDIAFRGRPAADGPKYRSLGNSFAVPVIAWIGRRIQQVDKDRSADQIRSGHLSLTRLPQPRESDVPERVLMAN